MSAPLLAISGTGTGIGKTHVTAALLTAWVQALREHGVESPALAGIKPVESGVTEGMPSDVATLEQASTFHVKHSRPPYRLRRGVSPHLAAKDEGRCIELAPIVAYVEEVRARVDGLAVELAGGLFSPLAIGLCNADVAKRLAPDALLLIAPDRLGVLHDVSASTRAANAMGVPIGGVILVAPEDPDASTGTNARELAAVTAPPVVAVVPRAPIEELARRDDVMALVRALLVPPTLAARSASRG